MIVDWPLVDVAINYAIVLLFGMCIGAWLNLPAPEEPSEMQIMLERLKHKTAIHYLESKTNGRFETVRSEHAGND